MVPKDQIMTLWSDSYRDPDNDTCNALDGRSEVLAICFTTSHAPGLDHRRVPRLAWEYYTLELPTRECLRHKASMYWRDWQSIGVPPQRSGQQPAAYWSVEKMVPEEKMAELRWLHHASAHPC
ncbi:hypothetical protein CIB48_g5782 [Xylaria polymorpha]|nr:hypothetical protein CIB48_g5782 [Xylaria polymorpha]